MVIFGLVAGDRSSCSRELRSSRLGVSVFEAGAFVLFPIQAGTYQMLVLIWLSVGQHRSYDVANNFIDNLLPGRSRIGIDWRNRLIGVRRSARSRSTAPSPIWARHGTAKMSRSLDGLKAPNAAYGKALQWGSQAEFDDAMRSDEQLKLSESNIAAVRRIVATLRSPAYPNILRPTMIATSPAACSHKAQVIRASSSARSVFVAMLAISAFVASLSRSAPVAW